MKYHEFINNVQDRTGLESEDAEQAAHSFFEMLSIFADPKDAKRLASQLPNELAETVRGTAEANPYPEADGFFEHIGSNQLVGHHYADAVWESLKPCISRSLQHRLHDQLPEDVAKTLN